MNVPVERVNAMKAIPLFRGLPHGDLERLASKAREVSHQPGDEIIKEGTSGSSVFLIVKGQAEVRRKTVNKRINMLGPGEFFGELSIISPSPRSASVLAYEPMTLLVLEGHDFRSALSSNISMAQQMIVTLAERLRELTDEFAPKV